MQTLQQLRVKHALEKVEIFEKEYKAKAAKILSRTAELPYMIRCNGLAQAAAFYKSKAKSNNDADGYGLVYKALEHWLCEHQKIFGDKAKDLVESITQHNMQIYFAASAEAEEYTYHLKTIAKAYL